MNLDEKETLAKTMDDGLEASGLRARAAREYAGLTQAQLGEKIGMGKQAIANVENGRSFPGRPLMVYLMRAHRVDINFMVLGAFSQLPSDVQDGLFEKLKALQPQVDQQSS
jgi:transcriptional regulator with XRE-family HTH domain